MDDLHWTCKCGATACHFPAHRSTSAVCYCRFCRHFIKDMAAETILDDAGGVELVHVLPDQIEFDKGQENLAVTHYTTRGARRWYTTCCGTPFANTPASAKLPYATIVADGISPRDALYPPRVVVNAKDAQGTIPHRPGFPAGIFVKWILSTLWSRASGRYKTTPFFDSAQRIVATPERRPRPPQSG